MIVTADMIFSPGARRILAIERTDNEPRSVAVQNNVLIDSFNHQVVWLERFLGPNKVIRDYSENLLTKNDCRKEDCSFILCLSSLPDFGHQSITSSLALSAFHFVTSFPVTFLAYIYHV